MSGNLTRRRVLKLGGATALGAAGVLRLTPAWAALAGAYELVDIGETFPDAANPAWLGANDMTAGGVVAGNMWISEEKRSPWLFRDGKLTRIKTGKFGGLISSINDEGIAVGRELLGWHGPDVPWGRPVQWVDGEKEVLAYPDALPDRAESGRAYSINNRGDVVGAVQIAGGASFPVIWRDGVPTVLPSLFEPGAGTAMLINDAGVAFGTVDDGAGGTMGVVWDGDAVSPLFGVPGGEGMVQPQGLGSDGMPLGLGWSGAAWDAMAWTGLLDEPQVLPQLVPGQLQAMAVSSDASGVIGGTVVVAEGDQRAVVWDNGQTIELGSLVANLDGAQLLVVRAFADDGRIAGSARFADNTIHAVLLEPVQ